MDKMLYICIIFKTIIIMKIINAKIYIIYIALFLFTFNSFVCYANKPKDTIKLKSIEVYSYKFSKYSESPHAYDVSSLIELVLKLEGNRDHGVVDTIYNPLTLAKIDSICRKNKIIKSEIEDSNNQFKSLGNSEGDIRLVFILNYTNKKIIIGLDRSKFMNLNYKKYKINKDTYNYLLSVLDTIIMKKLYGHE
jgi:hypothetical protein